MQAANEGAGEQRSFGLNITLPYEQTSNHVVAHSDKLINFYYFFVRKLNFVAESDAWWHSPEASEPWMKCLKRSL